VESFFDPATIFSIPVFQPPRPTDAIVQKASIRPEPEETLLETMVHQHPSTVKTDSSAKKTIKGIQWVQSGWFSKRQRW
jgi:multisubunit Na+/H+ antiporter MnhE subunit